MWISCKVLFFMSYQKAYYTQCDDRNFVNQIRRFRIFGLEKFGLAEGIESCKNFLQISYGSILKAR